MYKKSVSIAVKARHFVIKINTLMLFKEIIGLVVYSKNHTKQINTLCKQTAALLFFTADEFEVASNDIKSTPNFI
jgi:hypothetical protein